MMQRTRPMKSLEKLTLSSAMRPWGWIGENLGLWTWRNLIFGRPTVPGRSVDLRHGGKHCPGGKRMPESALWEVSVWMFWIQIHRCWLINMSLINLSRAQGHVSWAFHVACLWPPSNTLMSFVQHVTHQPEPCSGTHELSVSCCMFVAPEKKSIDWQRRECVSTFSLSDVCNLDPGRVTCKLLTRIQIKILVQID